MSNSDNQVILNEQPEGGGAWQERYSFKYSNFGSASFINKVRDFVTTHKQLLFVSIVCLLLFIGFIVDFSHGSRLRDLENGSREKSKDSWIDYDYSDDAPDLMVNMDVIGKYQRLCSAFYCPQSEYCYCLSKEAANFQAANRTCVQVLAGELAQFQDTDHEHEITYKLWRRSSLRKPVFWIGLTKTKDQKEPQWLNCTDCAKPSDLDSHEKKAVNVSHGDHSCLMISEGVLQKYPCISPRLRNHEKKYVMDESKSPYWFDEDVMGQVYGLNALCECNSRSAANRVPSKTSAL
ncbi:uncharacterized protein LOC142351721 [Convolutriloba macropyga]|uniref:uncharacterized protein LOC142351721 n=1 Tax=Convolutriloba macropyga TaxID=536237 RepID=UPI003F523F7C